MGCVNCKPSRSSLYAVDNQKNKSSRRRNKKSITSFIRKLFAGKKNCEVPVCDPTQEEDRNESETVPVNDVTQRNDEMHTEDGSMVAENVPLNGVITVSEGEGDGAEESDQNDEDERADEVNDEQESNNDGFDGQDVSTKEEKVISMDSGIVSMEDLTVDDSGALATKTKFDEVREKRYNKVISGQKKSLAETEAKIRRYIKLTRECVRRLTDMSKKRAEEMQNHPEGVAQMDAKMKCVLAIYFRCVRKLYKALRQRAISEAKKDFYEAKLDPEWNYSDKYASRKSFYLSPIQEEEEEEGL